MGMTYSELSVIGRLRKISKCGPYSMFCKLIHMWKDALSPMEVSKQCGTFFLYVNVTVGGTIEFPWPYPHLMKEESLQIQ